MKKLIALALTILSVIFFFYRQKLVEALPSTILPLFLMVAIVGIWILLAATPIYLLAKNKKFFTFGKEDEALIVVAGGKYIKTIVARSNAYVEDNGWIVRDRVNIPRDKKPSWLARKFGLFWIGIWPIFQVYRYKLKWVTWTQHQVENNQYAYYAEAHEEELSHVLISDYPYYVKITGAECQDMFGIDWELVITARCDNPYLAIFATHDWLRQMNAKVESAGRAFTGTQTFLELVENKVTAQTECGEFIRQDIATELHDRYGITIIGVNVVQISPPPDYVKQTTAVYAAQQAGLAQVKTAELAAQVAVHTKQAVITEAEGKAEAISVVAEAEAKRLKKIGGELTDSITGEGARFIRAADVAQAAAENTRNININGGESLITRALEALSGSSTKKILFK